MYGTALRLQMIAKPPVFIHACHPHKTSVLIPESHLIKRWMSLHSNCMSISEGITKLGIYGIYRVCCG